MSFTMSLYADFGRSLGPVLGVNAVEIRLSVTQWVIRAAARGKNMLPIDR